MRRERLSFPRCCALRRLLRGTTASAAHGVLLSAAAATCCFPLNGRVGGTSASATTPWLTDAPELLQPTTSAAMLRSSSARASPPHVLTSQAHTNFTFWVICQFTTYMGLLVPLDCRCPGDHGPTRASVTFSHPNKIVT
ncbi:hypothetical protein NDU88_004410 [Pleurodeles waltl]|uniref:Secreted protein n=1 Tax=Pleurodeles waltl TaxID=8319 RepID=A0AAV7NNG6_PLEWA|nr:hypothetical protein NDU88_004410 [Pleurodeles waltl]